MRTIRSRPMVSRLVAIFAVVIMGIATGWVAALALHQLVNPAPPRSAPAPASVQSPPNDPGPATSDKPDVIIAIPKHGGEDPNRYRYLSLGQIIKGIESIRHEKKKHHEGKDHNDKD